MSPSALSWLQIASVAMLASLGAANPNHHDYQETKYFFASYVAKFNKNYDSVDEFLHRMNLFWQTGAQIRHHNAHGAPHSFILGHNAFSDLTLAEKKRYFGYIATPPALKDHHELNYAKLKPNYDNSVDWRRKGAVGPVRNEGGICQSCWAFAVASAVESAHQIASGELLQLSPQQLVECDRISLGCHGGGIDDAFDYYQMSSAMLEKDYKYTADEHTCKYDPARSTGVNVTHRYNVQPYSVEQLKAAVALQPVAAAIEGYQDIFMQYKTGIFDSPLCGTKLDHAIVLVGFGIDSHSGDEYWILRNDWGTTWGEDGYMRLKMQDGAGICGINMAASFASVNK